MKDLEALYIEYQEILSSQIFENEMLDYEVFNKQLPFLKQLAAIKNSGVTVFDFSKGKHLFSSYNLSTIFDYDLEKIKLEDSDYFKSRIHPQDLVQLTYSGIGLLKFCLQLPAEKRKDYKLLNEYRILDKEQNYLRIIEQHQILELDAQGNLWLALSVIDISPNQDPNKGLISQMVDNSSGTIVDFDFKRKNSGLTPRENEVLALIKQGKLSKEISESLAISVHTVNTHRQKILKKLGANNSREAIHYSENIHLI